MKDKQESLERPSGRKPQLNLEVTETEKSFFGQVADARGMKLAALVRELLNNEGRRLGVPAMLENYKSRFPDYQYYVNAEEDSETKLGIFEQFLMKFKSDCDFSITSYEPESYNLRISCTAYSSSGETSSTILLGIASDRAKNYEERKAIDRAWHDILGLSLNLEDKWNGISYVAEKRRTLKGKLIILKQFVDKYRHAELSINASYSGKTALRVVAKTENQSKELLIEYLPQRADEQAELTQALEEYQRQDSQSQDVLL